jgi:hypothetical protein
MVIDLLSVRLIACPRVNAKISSVVISTVAFFRMR